MPYTPRYSIDHIPFLRLLLPLAIGIVWQYWATSIVSIVICGVLATLCGIGAWVARNNRFSTARHITFSTFVFTGTMCIGMIIYYCHMPRHEMPDTGNNCIATARITGPLVEQQNTYRTEATIIALHDDSATHSTQIDLQLHLQKSYTAGTLQQGDLIMFPPQLETIANNRNSLPYAFDYAHYMARKGILYRQYLRDNTWQLSTLNAPPTIYDRAAHIQQRCVENLYNSGLWHENASLLVALLWGDKTHLPDDVRHIFSAAGLSHILAVSGLHTGIIAFILWLLLLPLRFTVLNKARSIITIAILWIYAFITGLSPSVVRACIMATFVGTATLLNRHNTALNALCGSAVMILLFAPMQLFDIGFQLSYTAVAGILLMSPYLDIAYRLEWRNAIAQYISGIVAVSLSAQIATIPLAAYYFHYIPLWGLLSNLLLTPLLPLVVVVAILLQLFTATHSAGTWLIDMANTLTSSLISGANLIASLPGASIEGIWITPFMLLLYAIALLATWYAISRRTLQPGIVVLITILLMQGIVIYHTIRPSTPLALLPDTRQHTYLQLANSNHNCYIISTDSSHIVPRIGHEWRAHEQLQAQMVAHSDTISSTHIYIALPFIQYYNKRLLWVDENIWRYTHTQQPFDIDYAIITPGYTGKIKHLLKNFNIKNIILSNSIFSKRCEELATECEMENIPFHNSTDNGSWIYTPQQSDS